MGSNAEKSLVVGGSNGIGLAVANVLSDYGEVYIMDKMPPSSMDIRDNIEYIKFDLINEDYSIFDDYRHIDNLVVTAGFGRLALFDDISEKEIVDQITVNSIAPIRIIHHFFKCIKSESNFNCAIMVSIAGFMSSPFFSTYGASKAALKIFIESINVELERSGCPNRILNVSPGSLKGTRFSNGQNDLNLTLPIAKEIVSRMRRKEDLWIPMYDEIYKEVLERYHSDFRKEGLHSYDYKLCRINKSKIGS